MSQEICQSLGYQFNNTNLLKIALTHRSYNEVNNERLEFLGDSIVNFVVAEALYQKFPHAQEGDLSRWRASLVNRDALGKLARELRIGRFILLGLGELKSGGNERHSILSCTMEALIGAIYLDGGFAVTRDCIFRWYKSTLESLSNAASHKDPKTQLQEYLQGLHESLPIYQVESVEGVSHRQVFTVSCVISSRKEKILGVGLSRRRAEQEAAEKMLGILKNETY